ncbi:chaperonin 10-like protein [Cladorrhinum samala]|uniref:Chaperonin 10-like protein n=1 Tax=Cladorrhinum samala TaxID=585594 RepID=A0AAV9HEE0_9PEZI|nr:chaperonin 10-like protein [Cladorrhinum samala]
MAPPTEIKAVVIASPEKAEVRTVALPKIRDGYMLIRTVAVALNPTDWKHVSGAQNVNCRVGCDYVGYVEEVGPKVTKPFAKGDLVCGVIHGSNRNQPDEGAFGEYVVAKGDLQIKVPENLAPEQAATLGVGITTVGQGLYQALKLPLPTGDRPPIGDSSPRILIYGGSTATGILGIQYAALSGYRVATTCSPRNFSLMKSLVPSAEVFDYSSPTLVDDIKAWASGAPSQPLTLAWDCHATPESGKICAAALSTSEEGHYRSLLNVPEEVIKSVNPMVDSGYTFAYTAIGEAFDKTWHVPASEEDFEFAKAFWELSRQLLAEGKIIPAKMDVNRGGSGLEGVLVGLEELRTGKVSGTKLVYTL